VNGNLSTEPLFVDSVAGDCHLEHNSPAVDGGAATGAPAVDLDGTTRPFDGNSDGIAAVEIGAFEFSIRCSAVPRTDCRQPTKPGHGLLAFNDSVFDEKDMLRWRWERETTPTVEFGRPERSDDYLFCLYDASGPEPALLFHALAPSGAAWTIAGARSFRYAQHGGSPEGLDSLTLRAGADDDAKITLHGAGDRLSGRPLGMPTLPLPLPLIAQLQVPTGHCWENRYSESGVIRNDLGRFRAKPGS
jgi:hypothetical protein